jgi:hypothetical protein
MGLRRAIRLVAKNASIKVLPIDLEAKLGMVGKGDHMVARSIHIHLSFLALLVPRFAPSAGLFG